MMTDEERQKLLRQLRLYEPLRLSLPIVCRQAADEIERLAKELEISRKKEMKFRVEEPKSWIIQDDYDPWLVDD